MSQKPVTFTEWTLDSISLQDALTDFMLSRQAMRVSPVTLEWYKYIAGAFIRWLDTQGVTRPAQVNTPLVRMYQAELAGRGYKDTTLHAHARAVKTLLRFWHEEGYMPETVKVIMPKLEKKRLPVLTPEQVTTVLAACKRQRDKALLLFAIDTGLRLSELLALNWGDLNMSSGVVHVARGKGGKGRTVIAGASVRRALLAYRRELQQNGLDFSEKSPLFQTDTGERFSREGLAQVFKRLSRRSGVKFSAHALRRTFCILALRAGMDVLHLQALMGHASLEMTQHYAQMLDEDLILEHRAHSPVDNLSSLF